MRWLRRFRQDASRPAVCPLLAGARSGAALLVNAGVAVAVVAADAPIDYQRQVAPLLAERCLACHGVDDASRQGGLRLDRREDMLRGGDSGHAAVVPGQPDASLLLQRLASTDPAERMPPPEAGDPLAEAQRQVLRAWIAEGARTESHWAFVPPQKPATASPSDERHPIDALVAARLRQRGRALSPPASDAALCRRLHLDLIGLPPSPAEIAEFGRVGYAATVERLLASARFGEKWARHWLDAARYSDTNGYEKDLPRDQWAWRDWVVDAFNADMSYDRFVVEQIAGDLLPDATQEQRVATGFLRNSMINEEGAIVAEQFRMVEMFDRMDCLGKAVLGLTAQCAQCHSHKYDPLTQREYFGMFAFLNNAYEAQSYVHSPEQRQQLAALQAELAALDDEVRRRRPDWQPALEAWQESVRGSLAAWEPLTGLEVDSEGGGCHPTQIADLSVMALGYTASNAYLIAEPRLEGVTGLQLEVLLNGDLPYGGPGRSRVDGSWQALELEASVRRPGADAWEPLKLVRVTADFEEPHAARADGEAAGGPAALLIDGDAKTYWRADRGPGRRNQPAVAVVQFEQPLTFPAGTRLKVLIRSSLGRGDMIGCCRFSLTSDADPKAPPVDHAAVLALRKPPAERTPADAAALFAAWRRSVPELADLNRRIDAVWARTPAAMTSVLHLAERSGVLRRATHLLERGEWDRPQQPVEPHTPAALHPWPADAPRNRLEFARWLASPASPLAARVAVNRVWQAMFGEGLVETAEDFGLRAPVPEHLETLDWLAVDFMEHGWSHKHLIRTIVTSATYRQSSRVTPEQLQSDPRNRWLARGPRFRADAEVVRDTALTAAGLIAHRLGGPPVIPPVPQNVLDYNYVYPDYWKPTEGPDRYRRTLYGFRKRSMPDPAMSSFDAPNGDVACVRRARSNSPLAALVGLNETVFFEAAQALALRVLREGGAADADRADYAFSLCTSRSPTDAERDELLALLASRRRRLAEGWLNPRAIATGDAAKLPELPPHATPQDAAAWTLVARVLLNLDETISKY
jgi:hypothetical protein